ncbi:uncharacterized protein MONBRDRAFT_33376 [Monosiga brevicollis MX1]|uniref:MATH domain-containing protein n=1 Tax=Monosiga brevicollis TaxID=81824 RepID=A9V526_MONBE|nr:uncharacterized protein MONBRDRAFT_33376 [Monosiga brevicollis MX1]EDQ87306.1 predicted protein [Monosiga brevicollis MX1]|eukprot:XP_001747919.1 hypothetical protein [Monosiga brevicollis MX1]
MAPSRLLYLQCPAYLPGSVASVNASNNCFTACSLWRQPSMMCKLPNAMHWMRPTSLRPGTSTVSGYCSSFTDNRLLKIQRETEGTEPEAEPATMTQALQLQLRPEYLVKEWALINFVGLARTAEHGDFAYSTPLMLAGYEFAIKVYPMGTGEGQQRHFSAFLELRACPHGDPDVPLLIDWSIELLPQESSSARPVQRQGSNIFALHECWGFDKFYQRDDLEAEGFLQSDRKELRFRFRLRPHSFRVLAAMHATQARALQLELAQVRRTSGKTDTGSSSTPNPALNLTPSITPSANTSPPTRHVTTSPGHGPRSAHERVHSGLGSEASPISSHPSSGSTANPAGPINQTRPVTLNTQPAAIEPASSARLRSDRGRAGATPHAPMQPTWRIPPRTNEAPTLTNLASDHPAAMPGSPLRVSDLITHDVSENAQVLAEEDLAIMEELHQSLRQLPLYGSGAGVPSSP